MINSTDFSKLYAHEHSISEKEAAAVCAGIWKLLGKVLFTLQEDISIHKVGTLKRQRVAAKKFKHPVTGVLSKRVEKTVIKFKQSDFPYT